MQEPKHRVGIIGIGMVGAPLARYFGEGGWRRGESLLLYDIDPKKNYSDDVNKAEVVFVSVPTPRSADGSCDIRALESSFGMLKGDKIVVIKSTVSPGTTERLQNQYPNFKVLFNPEFLSESRAWEDFIRPDRQIVGFTEKSLDSAGLVLSLLPKAPFMSPWGQGTYQHTRITATEAEIIKYAGNIHFVRKVNWANALAKVAEKMGADYDNIRKGMAADHRIGDSHLDVNHGGYKGWGGFCFPKDLDAFIHFAGSENLGEVKELLLEDRRFNENLLKEQGLTLEDVSRHADELKQKLDQGNH